MLDFSKFYQLSQQQRLGRLNLDRLPDLSLEASDKMVENSVGVFGLPLGIACHFVVDRTEVWVPMAIEEPSVIAGASHVAKLASATGGFKTQVDDGVMKGQIQLTGSRDWDAVSQIVFENRANLIQCANQTCQRLVARGGGCLDLEFRVLNSNMAVMDFKIDCLDAMGANLINTLLESIAPDVEQLTGARVGFKILSNLSDQRLARASCEIPYKLLATDQSKDNGREIASRIVKGYELACLDPYRACTHNKGIMNGVDAVVIATGNDWRAIEAGAHAYAATKYAQYGPLSHFELDDTKLVLKASIELPLALGVVGGVTKIHPTVQACLKLLGPFSKSAKKLASLIASVGLAQNIAAMRALAAEGIQHGHMALHSRKQN